MCIFKWNSTLVMSNEKIILISFGLIYNFEKVSESNCNFREYDGIFVILGKSNETRWAFCLNVNFGLVLHGHLQCDFQIGLFGL